MMKRFNIVLVLILAAGFVSLAAEPSYTLKSADAAPPAELKAPIRDLLAPSSFHILNDKGEVYCEIWFRKTIPAKATDEQIKNGLTYRELDETSVLGAIRFPQPTTDYRKNKIPGGVYTLRLAFQPQDGDHMGTSPYPEFCLLRAADKDDKPDVMAPKALHEASKAAIKGNHPAAFLLFPHEKADGDAKLTNEMNHWILRTKLKVDVNGKPATIGVGLVVVGHSEGAE